MVKNTTFAVIILCCKRIHYYVTLKNFKVRGISVNKKLKFGSVLFAASLALAGCSSNTVKEEPKGDKIPPKNEEKKVTYGNWSTFGYDLELTRHVPYDEITKDNVKDLGIVWSKSFKELNDKIPAGNQNFPVVVDGVAYVTTSGNYVYAFDAVTGDVIWEWTPPKEVAKKVEQMGMPASNRGVAIGEGKVFMLTSDVGLVSIDQKTGKTINFIHMSDFYPDVKPENGYYETTAPVYYDGKIFIGSSGGDNGVRGFEMAFKASDLTPAWDEPFWTVPPKGEDWLADGLFGGGGAVWMPPSIDQETGLMYIATGNPAPDFYGEKRPGANPHTDSIVALEADTGKLVWAEQEVSHDLWDYDAADSPSIITAKVKGKERKLVVEGGKSAQWWAFDAATGDIVYDGIPFGKIEHSKPTKEGVQVYPGVLGGQNYAPDTFDPKENIVLIPGIEEPSIMKTAKNEQHAKSQASSNYFGIWAFGTSYASDANIKGYGTITAIDLNDGKIRYQIKTNEIMRGGLTSTKTGLTFFGELSGKVKAIETATGKILWDFQTSGNTISAAPSIFEKDGKTYMMITSAGTKPQIFCFALGGDKTQASNGHDESKDPHKGK